MYAEVILPLPLKNTFTYGIPFEMEKDLQVGSRVEVSFGRNKAYSAIVKEIHNRKPDSYTVKPILSVLDDTPVVTGEQIELWEWMASYYLCTIGEVMNAALPSYLKLEGESIVSLKEGVEINEEELSDDEFILIEALKTKQERSQ